MGYYGWKPYVPVAERRKKAEKSAAKAKKAGATLSPVTAATSRGAIAKTFWGKSWCDNLERYSDYANRLPRGRAYVRNGSVIDLKIKEGEVQAQIMGSSLYKVAVKITEVPKKRWQSISADCAGSIDTLVELLQGKLSKAVMERICKPSAGLFPAPKEIEFTCSCPDWASMCKHVAAALYGVGARLDEKPELMFTLRGVDAKDLVTQAGAGLPKSKRAPAAGKVLDDALLADVFGIEMAEAAPAKKSVSPRKKPATTKAPTAGKTEAPKKTVAVQKKPAKAKAAAKTTASLRKPTTIKAKSGSATTAQKGKAATATTGRASSRLAKGKSR